MPYTIDSTSTIAYSSWLALGVAAIGILVTGPSVGAQIGGSDLGENNTFSEWFGYFNRGFEPWVYHSEHEWIFINPGDPESSLFFYDWILGWVWTSETIYPDLFAFDRGVWLRYALGTANPRRFFDATIDAWVEYFRFSGSARLYGFDTSNLVFPDVSRGTIDRDNIPALSNPRFTPASEVDFLTDEDVLITITIEGETRAYPLRILNWHEIVNDRIGDTYFAISYCPLCFSGWAFDREVNGKLLTFGVSGLLHKNNLIMYDRETESLWSQFLLEAVSGKMLKIKLEWIPNGQVNWRSFREMYPDSAVLNTDTGFDRLYDFDPYEIYRTSDRVIFRVDNASHVLHPKAVVWGVEIDGVARAYPRDALPDGETFEDMVNGMRIQITYFAESESIEVFNADTGKPVEGLWNFWFTWGDFFPHTTIWSPD